MTINLGKWWSVFAAILTSAVAAFSPTVQSVLASHPVVTAVVGSLLMVVMHMLPSPLTASATQKF